MTTEDIRNIVAWLIVVGTIPSLGFTFLYGFRSPWWRSALGRILFGLMVTVSAILTSSVCGFFFGVYPGYYIVAIILYALLSIMLWLFFISLIIERRSTSASSLEIPLQHTGTEEVQIVNKEK